MSPPPRPSTAHSVGAIRRKNTRNFCREFRLVTILILVVNEECHGNSDELRGVFNIGC